MSISCFIQQDEFVSFAETISSYFGLPIVFTVYIPESSLGASYYIRNDNTKMVFNTTLYPVNLLRDLSIESIQTTHYMNIDADLFISSLTSDMYLSIETIQQSIKDNSDYLLDERNVLLILTFMVVPNKVVKRCRMEGVGCNAMCSLFYAITVVPTHFQWKNEIWCMESGRIDSNAFIHPFMLELSFLSM